MCEEDDGSFVYFAGSLAAVDWKQNVGEYAVCTFESCDHGELHTSAMDITMKFFLKHGFQHAIWLYSHSQ